METPRWWHVAVAAGTVFLVAILATTGAEGLELWGPLGVLAAFAVVWYSLGWAAWRSDAVGFVVSGSVIAATGIGTALNPSMATFQSVAFPLIWALARTIRGAVIANVVLAVAVFVGFLLSTGTSQGAVAQATAVQGVSLGFSLALGLWISGIALEGERSKQLLDELQAAQEQLAVANREAGQAAERERMSRELHDGIAQGLTGLVMLVQTVRRDLDRGDAQAAAERLAVLEENARDALVETRTLVAASAPVEGGGIEQALRRLGERFSRESGLDVRVEVEGTPGLDREAEVVMLRCAQEALANIRKHAAARSARLVLAGTVLTVSDDGRGFDPAAPSTGFGIAGMRDRVTLAGGTLSVESGASGTVLRVELPQGDAS